MSLRNNKRKYEFNDVINSCSNVSSVNVHDNFANAGDVFKTPSTSRWRSKGSTNPALPSTSSASAKFQTPSSALRSRSYSTCTSSSRTTVGLPSIIIAVAEGRGHARGEIGLASLDLKNPELTLSQFPDSHTYFKTLTTLNLLQPLEVIVPNTAFDSGSMNVILKLIKDNFPKTITVSVQRRYFNETKGLEYIQRLSLPECRSTEMIIADKYYALAAAAALLKYVEFIQNIVYTSKSIKVRYAGGEKTTMIDMKTCYNLELLININDPKSEHTLFGVLHNTKSVGGTRLLRANILQPPFCLETTEIRLNCVNELLTNQELLVNLQTIISKFVDVDNLLSLCVQIPKENNIKVAEMKITNIINLKHTLELVEPLASALQNAQCSLLQSYYSMLNDDRYKVIYEKIVEVINIDTVQHKGTLNMRAQKCFAVKSNLNGLLDIARRSYAELIDDITNLVKQLSEIHNLPLCIGHSSDKGFFIQMSINKRRSISVEQLPSSFIKAVKIKNIIRFTTEDLMKLNVRAEESLQEIYLMSDTIISKLLEEITQYIGCLYKLCEIISYVDMQIAFAEVSAASNYVRPEFTDSLAIKGGRHPILDRISNTPIISNTAFLCNDLNFGIITGPNMSGKSTYLKQIALMQILAQIGCFVPAEYASFRLADHIYSRAGSSDDIETNTSTFMMEMKEINYIKSTATNSSLIIIDELGRGTSVEEGIGICYAICEHLIRTKAFVLFATHFMELTELDATYPNVNNYFFDVETDENIQNSNTRKFRFTYTIKEGKCPLKNYGIRLAELSLLHEGIITNAKMIALSVSNESQNQNNDDEKIGVKAVLSLSKKLHHVAKNSTLSPSELKTMLTTFKETFLDTIKDI